MARSNPLKFGFVGSGYMARIHARALQASEGTEIYAWSARHWENAASAAREFGGRPMTTERLLDHAGLDAVVVATPTSQHENQVIKALETRKHVFCESPIARNRTQAAAMLKAAERSAQRFYVAHSQNFFPSYVAARDLLLSGAIGVLRRAICTRLNPMPEQPDHWLLDFAQSGGCILDLLIHEFNFLNWCLGAPTRVEVETEAGKDPMGLRHAVVHLYFENGAMAKVEGSLIHERRERSLIFEGNLGQIIIDPVDGKLKLENSRGIQPIDTDADDPYKLQMTHFVSRLGNKASFLSSQKEACAALEVALAGLSKLEKSMSLSS